MSKQKKYKDKIIKIHMVFWIILILFFSSVFFAQSLRIKQYRVIADEIKRDIEKERLTYEELLLQIEMNNTDEFYEKIAREQLNMVKPDEILFYTK